MNGKGNAHNKATPPLLPGPEGSLVTVNVETVVTFKEKSQIKNKKGATGITFRSSFLKFISSVGVIITEMRGGG